MCLYCIGPSPSGLSLKSCPFRRTRHTTDDGIQVRRLKILPTGRGQNIFEDKDVLLVFGVPCWFERIAVVVYVRNLREDCEELQQACQLRRTHHKLLRSATRLLQKRCAGFSLTLRYGFEHLVEGAAHYTLTRQKGIERPIQHTFTI